MTQNELDAVQNLITEAQAVVNRFRVLSQLGRRIVRDDINVNALEQALYAIPKLTTDEPQSRRKVRS